MNDFKEYYFTKIIYLFCVSLIINTFYDIFLSNTINSLILLLKK